MGQIHFEIYRARDGFRWRLWSANGRIIAESGEAYVQHAGALQAVTMVKQYAHIALIR